MFGASCSLSAADCVISKKICETEEEDGVLRTISSNFVETYKSSRLIIMGSF